jgi:small subunit ribosomal protein S6
MTFQIRHQADAEYHLLQFTAPGELIAELSHTLRITDGVLRHRVIKVRPGTPAAPSSPPPVVAGAASSGPTPAAASPAAAPAPEQEAAAVGASGAESSDEDVEAG